MKKENLIKILILSGLLLSFTPTLESNAATVHKNNVGKINRSVERGWIKNNGTWYYKDNNGSLVKGWKKISNKWYYMDNKGKMQTGWVKLKGIWYYLNENGDMATGWKKVKDKWYYMNSDGEMQKGWVKLKGIWYYLNENGDMATGWKQIKDKWYYMNSDGEMQTGWLKLGDKKYYLKASGERATGKIKIDNKEYEFNNDGTLKIRKAEWIKKNGKWYYKNEDGTLAKGWKKINNKWYYMNKDGERQTGWLKLNDKWYYLNDDGDMATGWKKVRDKWYYMNKDGEMQTGWLKLDDKWYYLNKNGDMRTDRIDLGNKSYEFNSDGSMKNQEYGKGKLTDYTMNLRRSPSLDSEVLTTVKPNSNVEILGREKGDLTYYHVKYNDGGKTYYGYISIYLGGDTAVQVYDDNYENDYLGVLSEKYESNGDPGCVSSGEGDYGGKSYGAWQLSSKLGSLDSFVNWLLGQNSRFYKELTDARKLDNGSNCGKHFDAAWKKIAKEHYNEFYNLQHSYTKITFYNDLVNRLQKDGNFDKMLNSFAVRNVLWSTAVQHGGYGAYRIIEPLKNIKNVEDFITAVYKERGRKNSEGGLVHFPNCSKAVQRAVANRYIRENEDAINMYEYSL
ncbi:SH3 domain-containing protein [Clostridium sp. Ade.TY]|uniref:VgrG-related protein n=1 Tax=Clostridium sp. Ade.TY TaxID=1391647 RepID=UPI00040BE9CD|nr:SH3 domain-containing protein [Clostridium sp. Ade.TY]